MRSYQHKNTWEVFEKQKKIEKFIEGKLSHFEDDFDAHRTWQKLKSHFNDSLVLCFCKCASNEQIFSEIDVREIFSGSLVTPLRQDVVKRIHLKIYIE